MTATTDLETWVQTFLRGVGNNTPFADGLQLEPRAYFGPFPFPLSLLTRCCGPEEGMKYRNPPEDFERRVEGLRAFLRSGGDLPPLIVNCSGGRLELNDGNHRHEALVREGRTSVPIIVWTTGEADRKAFAETLGVWMDLHHGHEEASRLGRQAVIGCLVLRPDGRIFAQKRSATRKTFPGCWDLVGGHVESGETVAGALVRELREETGWDLDAVLGLRKTVDWESPGSDGKPVLKREFVVAVSIRSGWDSPVLEPGKVTEGRWFSASHLAVLNDNRAGQDTYVYDLFQGEFSR